MVFGDTGIEIRGLGSRKRPNLWNRLNVLGKVFFVGVGLGVVVPSVGYLTYLNMNTENIPRRTSFSENKGVHITSGTRIFDKVNSQCFSFKLNEKEYSPFDFSSPYQQCLSVRSGDIESSVRMGVYNEVNRRKYGYYNPHALGGGRDISCSYDFKRIDCSDAFKLADGYDELNPPKKVDGPVDNSGWLTRQIDEILGLK